MSSLHHPASRFPLNPADEALELRDCGASDLSPTLGTQMTWEDVEDMARRQAARPAGYVEAACLACGCCLYVPENQRAGDVLCPECERAGAELAAEEDDRPCALCGGGADDPRHGGGHYSSEVSNQHEYEPAKTDDGPRPPTSGALHPDSEYFRDSLAKWPDDQLICGIGLASEGHASWGTAERREAWLAAATEELLKRVDAPRLAA